MSRHAPYFERQHPWDSRASGPYYVDHPHRRSYNAPSLMYARHDGPPGAYGNASHHHDKFTDPIGGYDPGGGARNAGSGYAPSPLRQGQNQSQGQGQNQSQGRGGSDPRYFTRYDFPESYEITNHRLREYPADRPGAFEARRGVDGGGPGGPGGDDFRGIGPKNWQRADDRILEDVCEKITMDPRVDASEISIDVDDGIVILSGEVHDRRMKRLAEDVVEMARGVRDVRNRLSFELDR